jgi:hypothetical protein
VILKTILSILLIVPVGLYSKRGYHGPGAAWVHDSLGGVFYVIFWCLVASLVPVRWKAAWIAAAVLIGTCILEFLQAWHPPLLEMARSTFVGRTILGSYFDWFDFPYYFAGAAIGWVWLRAIGRE